MKKVITYGTYDLLHHGHIKLLERAKALGDYLIVGVTADDFDKTRGKINVQQSLMERIEGVRSTGLADEIIIEEYEGQKIDDIIRLGVDIFTVGSDWIGKFDYLNEYCKVVYLDRTEGVSSSELRTENSKLKIGIVGDSNIALKFFNECEFVNGAEVVCCYNENKEIKFINNKTLNCTNSYDDLLKQVDAVYIISHPDTHYKYSKYALKKCKHVICESPLAFTASECEELYSIAESKKCVLLEGIKTAYATAFLRMLLLIKGGIIGDIVSIDATCTSLQSGVSNKSNDEIQDDWNSICAWGPTALLPVFHLFGSDYIDINITSKIKEKTKNFDLFTKIDFLYKDSVATIKIGTGVKSEGELIISGTKGYIYVPAPWWKTDYFEVRFENQEKNKRYFYQLDGEGIRYEIVAFVKRVQNKQIIDGFEKDIALAICKVMEKFYNGNIKNI